MTQLLIERFCTWLRGYKHDKELKNLHPAFRKTNDGCWYYNYQPTVKNITYKVRVIFDWPFCLNNCRHAAKISHNTDKDRGGKYVGFLYGTEEEKRAILSYASRLPYAELIILARLGEGSMAVVKQTRIQIPKFRNKFKKSKWLSRHSKSKKGSIMKPVATSIKNENAFTEWIKSVDFFYVVLEPDGNLFGHKKSQFLFAWTEKQKVEDFMSIFNKTAETPLMDHVIVEETRVGLFTKARRLKFNEIFFNPVMGNASESVSGINNKETKYYSQESNLSLTAYTEEELRTLYS